jgi:hypothetical protein
MDALKHELDTMKATIAAAVPIMLPPTTNNFNIPNFTGETLWSASFEDWLEKFDLLSRALGWSLKQKLYLLPAHLEGYALEIYRSQPPGIQADYTDLVSAMKLKLQLPHNERYKAVALSQRRLKKDEPIGQFATDLRRLARAAYPTMDANNRDLITLETFIRGLPRELKKSLLDKEPENLDDAVLLTQKIIMRDRVLDQEDFYPSPKLEVLQNEVEALRAQIKTVTENNNQFQQNRTRNYGRPQNSQYTSFPRKNFSYTQPQNFQRNNQTYRDKRVQFWEPQPIANFNTRGQPICRH